MKSKILFIAVLLMAGALTLGCSKEDVVPKVPADNVVTLTTTVSLVETKALDPNGKKTFKAGDKIAVVYENESNAMVKAESAELPSGTYGKSATFSVTLTNPKASGDLHIIYPATMAKDDGDVNYDALATQDGSLSTLGDNLDLAMFEGSLTASKELPESIALTNRLAICAFTLKNSDGTDEITSSITGLLVYDGTNSYYVSRAPAAGPIYVAIRPVSGVNIEYTAKSNAGYYVKTVTGKTYEANNLYPLGLRMTALPQGMLPGKFSVSSTDKVYFSKGNLQYVGTSWQFATNQWDFFGDNQSDGHRDLFGWGTGDAPNKVSTGSSDYSSFTDWGTNPITNGGNTANYWRTPTRSEWFYVIDSRTTTSNLLYAKATVNGVGGIILLPDDWSASYHALTSANDPEVAFTTNIVNAATWESDFEAHGAVFLPAAGYRTSSYGNDDNGYWSQSSYDSYNARYLHFHTGNVEASYVSRSTGYSVRLVKVVE
jgi:hypothetical protein